MKAIMRYFINFGISMMVSVTSLSGCAEIAATAVSNGLDITAGTANLNGLSDKEFCKRSMNRWNFDGPATDAFYAEKQRRFGEDQYSNKACAKVLNKYGYSSTAYGGQSQPNTRTNGEPTNTRQPVSPAMPYVAPSNSGLTAIIRNPQMPANQALAICSPQANAAKSQASNQSKQALRPTPYQSTCKQNYSGGFDCSSQRTSGGFWGGVADGVASSSAGHTAYNAVLDSCLAQYGWRNP